MKLRSSQKQPARAVRQRTIVDRPQSPAFSYLARRDERVAGEGRKQTEALSYRRRLLSARFWARRSGLLLLIIVALVCLVRIASLSSNPRIIVQQDSSTVLFRAPDIYQHAAQRYLQSSIWNRNKLTIDTGAASRQLEQQFPELASVTITLPLMSERPVYYVRLNPPVFTMQTISGSFIIDSTGRILAARDSVQHADVDKLITITDQTGLHAQLGQQVLSSDNVRFIQTVSAELAGQHLAVDSFTLPAGSTQEVDAHISGQAYAVKFNMQSSSTARQQAGTYLAVLHNLQTQHKLPAQYIDVRVVGRAYYL